MLVSAAVLSAQEPAKSPTLHVDVSVVGASLYRGDATVGSVGATGIAGSFTARSRSGVGAEAFALLLPRDEDSYDLNPRLLAAGAWVTGGFSRSPEKGLDVFAAGGFVLLGVQGWPDFSGCTPEVGCFREGGPNFENGWGLAPIVGGGVTFGAAPFVVRADVQAIPSNDVARQSTILARAGLGFLLP